MIAELCTSRCGVDMVAFCWCSHGRPYMCACVYLRTCYSGLALNFRVSLTIHKAREMCGCWLIAPVAVVCRVLCTCVCFCENFFRKNCSLRIQKKRLNFKLCCGVLIGHSRSEANVSDSKHYTTEY